MLKPQHILALAGASTLLFAFAPAAMASDVTVQGTVTGASLSINPSPTALWSATLAASGDVTAGYSDAITTNNNLGTGSSWGETITSTSYVGTSGDALTSGQANGHNTTGLNHGAVSSFGNSVGSINSVITGTTAADAVDCTLVYEVGCSTNTATANSVSYGSSGLVVPQNATGSRSPVSFFSTPSGTGMGNFTLTPSVSVVVPSNAYAGSYQSTVTVDVTVGP
jgi:hypothetical protein